ncbi:MAG: hypothetical protein JST60_22410 [Chloroflexi bacterium SZAS-1]|nr:hypothetical protein [Chloroflexi bacterium SZAS-1]HNP88623.1 hypothetical protein [Kouleothrix sp.]
MTTLVAPADTLAESQRLMTALEHLNSELPFASTILAVHQPTHHELQQTHERSERAVNLWRAALAHRWECEVAGRRLYKRLLRQMIEHYGSEHAPAIQLISRSGAEANSSPTELLADLRRLNAALKVGETPLFGTEPQAEVEQHCTALDRAIQAANTYETERRNAVLEHRMAREAYRRVRTDIHRQLEAHYGERFPAALSEVFSE